MNKFISLKLMLILTLSWMTIIHKSHMIYGAMVMIYGAMAIVGWRADMLNC